MTLTEMLKEILGIISGYKAKYQELRKDSDEAKVVAGEIKQVLEQWESSL